MCHRTRMSANMDFSSEMPRVQSRLVTPETWTSITTHSSFGGVEFNAVAVSTSSRARRLALRDTLRRALAETTVRRTEILAVAAEPPRRASELASSRTWSYIISLPRRRGRLQVQRPMQRISIALPCGGYMYISLDEFRQRRVEASPGVTRA